MIRKANYNDLVQIEKVFEYARSFMRKTGNLTQWAGGYPQKEILEEDIEKDRLFVFENDGEIIGLDISFNG